MNEWIITRSGEVRAVFPNRMEAVKYLKAMLKQTLKDFGKQDKSGIYDYSYIIPEITMKPVEYRESYLGL